MSVELLHWTLEVICIFTGGHSFGLKIWKTCSEPFFSSGISAAFNLREICAIVEPTVSVLLF